MATNTVTILQDDSPQIVPVTSGFFVDYAGTQDSDRTFNIAEGAGAENLDAGVTVNIEGTSEEFDYLRDGSTLKIINSEGEITAEILASPGISSTVRFDDGETEVAVAGNQITFGGLSFDDGEIIDGATTTFDFEDTVVGTVVNLTTKFNETDNNVVGFNIATENASEGEIIALSFAGDITDDDVEGILPASAIVDSEGNAAVELAFRADMTTEGEESFTLLAAIGDEGPVASPEIIIEDTSIGTTEINVGGGTSTFNAASGSFNFIDNIETSNSVEILNFGSDDQITFEGGVSVADVSFQESGNNTQFEIDNESGIVSRITLLGVTTDAFSVGGFNNNPDFGDVVFA